MFGAIFVSQTTNINKKIKDRYDKVDKSLNKSKENIKKLRSMHGTFEIIYKNLYENAEALEFILENLDIFVGYIDNEMKYTYVNKAYENFFNMKKEDILGKTVEEILSSKPDLWNARKEDIEAALKGETIEYEMEIELNGHNTRMECRYIPHRCHETGIIKGFTVIAKPLH